MKANTKITALEILVLAGVEKPEEKIGKVRVRIAGIAGIVTPDHLISIGTDVKKVDIIIGTDKYEIKVEGVNKDAVITEETKKAIEVKATQTIKINKARTVARKAEAEARVKKAAEPKPVVK